MRNFARRAGYSARVDAHAALVMPLSDTLRYCYWRGREPVLLRINGNAPHVARPHRIIAPLRHHSHLRIEIDFIIMRRFRFDMGYGSRRADATDALTRLLSVAE